MTNQETMTMIETMNEGMTAMNRTESGPAQMEAFQQTYDSSAIDHLERYPGVRRDLTQEQLDAREEHRLELEKDFSYDDYKAVRKEMHSSQLDPAVTIRRTSVTFNKAVIDSLAGVSYVNVFFSEKQGKMAIKPVSRNTPHAMRWCSDGKDNKRKPRRVSCPEMTKWFFETMGWDNDTRYRVLGYLIEVDGEKV